MEKILLKERGIGKHLAVRCELKGDEIRFYIASLAVSANFAFKVKEWNQFLEAVNTANANFELV